MFNRRENLPYNYSIKDMANDQAKAMENLGIKSACVVGISQGGMIALYLAMDHPELIEKLIFSVYAPCVNEIIAGCVNSWINLQIKISTKT